MECNKDEATRAKQISEEKFLSKDIAGAKKFALKAQNLYPDLDGISSMLATLNVYISAENKICGEADWYGVLGVNQFADEETIRKQYRKLALKLHPDKNKSIGAEGAFKFISQAWSVLSDKARRLSYDHKRSLNVYQQNVQPPSASGVSAPAPPGYNGYFNFTKSTTSNKKVPMENTTKVGSSHKRKPPAAPHASTSSHKETNVKYMPDTGKKPSFWTVCLQCKMHYEYLRRYLNQNLLCPNCHKPFVAVERNPPSSIYSKVSTEWNFSAQQENSNHQNRNAGSMGVNGPDSSSSHNTMFKWGPFTKPSSATSAAQAADMVKQTYNKVKREREEAQDAIKREKALRRKNRKTGSFSLHGNSNAFKRRKQLEECGGVMNLTNGAHSTNLEQGNVNGTSTVQYPLMEKARMEIRKKLKEWSSSDVLKSAVNLVNGAENYVPCCSNADLSRKRIQPISIEVPDSEFHNFDGDRTQTCFGENEVWAAYDDDDGMPRHYAMINNVISSDPFKIRISWLNTKTSDNNWDYSGFPKMCGDFGIGKKEISSLLYSFSHKVRWSEGTFGAVQIYPMKGEVWALYKNWSPQWNEFTDHEVIHKYDIVEIVEGYEGEELGVSVIPLIKVAGFKTVFHHHLDPNEKRIIPQEELDRFSHQIPSYLITGQEALNAPKGCWELDPAATPAEFRKVYYIS